MRVVAVHSDVLVATSAHWQTNCTLVRSGVEAFVIDSPVLPAELEALPAVAEQGGFRVAGLLATHADWDHLLGRYAFPGMALGVGETSAARLRAEPGSAQRELRAFDDEHYVERGPLSLGEVQALPVPGKLEVGSEGFELELHSADGHTSDGTAIVVPWAGVLVCGDYLSPVEIPWISADGGSASAYEATLTRLEPLVAAAESVVPGHGGPLTGARAAELLAEDRAYLAALRSDGAAAPLPPGRTSPAQRKIHAQNAGGL
jgi:glyoxylase-like metal-dependent hydrolase (beta-lactamase superfamily II)